MGGSETSEGQANGSSDTSWSDWVVQNSGMYAMIVVAISAVVAGATYKYGKSKSPAKAAGMAMTGVYVLGGLVYAYASQE